MATNDKPAFLPADELESMRRELENFSTRPYRHKQIADALLVEIDALRGRIETALDIIGENGDDCDCGHHAEEHDDTCDPCLACRIETALKGKTV